MDDSDSECYEQLDESISPSNSSYVPKARSATHTGVGDSWRSTSHSPIPYDIDKRPPYPVPKTTTKLLGEGNSYLTYDRITVSPVAPDYEMSSISPPRASYSFPSSGIQKENKPPLPPINPNRKPPSRSQSESSDQLSQTPPRSLTTSVPRQLSATSRSNGSRHSRSNSESDVSPTLTPSRQGLATASQIRTNSIESIGNGQTFSYYKSSQEMPLRVFVEKHRDDLPVQVVVTKGFYGADERTSISDGDMFNIHFFKQTKVVKIQDSNKYQYTVPLNSALEFGLVYPLPSGFKQVDSKYHFKTVGDILQLKNLPKAVRATKSHRGGGPDSSVEQNDLLLVKEVKQKRGLKSTKVLKCVHAGTGMKKTLSEDCAGFFSVRPLDIRLFLPEVVEHIQLPQKAILYSSSNTRIDLPTHLLQSEIEILRMEIEESIVATTILDKQESKRIANPYQNTVSTPLVDIPQDLDIEVAVIKLGDGETDQLYAETRHLCERYNPGDAAYLNLQSSITASAQTTLFRTVRQDHNRQVGIEILRPVNAFRNSDQSVNRLSNSSDSSRKLLCTPSECANAEEVNGRLESLESHATNIDDRFNKFELMLQKLGNSNNPDIEEQKHQLVSIKNELVKEKQSNEELQRIVKDLTDQVTKLNATVDTLQRTVDLLQSDVKKKPKDHKHATSANGTVTSCKANGMSSVDFETQNKEYLQRLDHSQVKKLLSTMNLGQYEENFAREQITGEILVELNEGVLEKELGMASKIHRIKLMKVIIGRHSAMSIINGDDPYYVHLTQSK